MCPCFGVWEETSAGNPRARGEIKETPHTLGGGLRLSPFQLVWSYPDQLEGAFQLTTPDGAGAEPATSCMPGVVSNHYTTARPNLLYHGVLFIFVYSKKINVILRNQHVETQSVT